MESRRRLSLHLRSLRRLSHRQVEWHQHPGRNLHVVRRSLELLQLRQLDLPAFLRLFEYSLVFQWDAYPDLSERQAEDRAWFINGWQSYGKFNKQPGVGLQVLWRPNGWFSVLGNQYYGADTLGSSDRKRYHTDDSIIVKYHDDPSALLSKAAVSLTIDAGCESGGGVSCTGGSS